MDYCSECAYLREEDYKGMTYGLQICYGLANEKVDPAFIQVSNINTSGYSKVKVK